jgi:hypothetical protein
MPARIPRTQTRLKTAPTKGFRQEALSCAVGGEFAKAATRMSPKKENVRKTAETIRRVVLKSDPLMLLRDLGLRGICKFFSLAYFVRRVP